MVETSSCVEGIDGQRFLRGCTRLWWKTWHRNWEAGTVVGFRLVLVRVGEARTANETAPFPIFNPKMDYQMITRG